MIMEALPFEEKIGNPIVLHIQSTLDIKCYCWLQRSFLPSIVESIVVSLIPLYNIYLENFLFLFTDNSL